MSILSIKGMEKKQDQRLASIIVSAIKDSLESGEYTTQDLIPAINDVLKKMAKKDKVLVENVVEELRKYYPQIADSINLS